MEGETKGGGLGVSKRQMFYVEIKPGQTAIVSWRKLLRDSQDGRSKGVQCSELSAMSERLEYNVTSSRHKQQRIVETTSTKGANNSDPLSRRRRLKNTSTKIATGDVVASMKNITGNSNKLGCPPYLLNTVMDASVFSSKTKLSNLPITEKVCFKRRKMDVGLKRNASDSNHEKGKSIPLQNSPKCRELMDGKKVEVSSKSQHNDKSCQRKGIVNVVSHGFTPPLKHLVSTKEQKETNQSEPRIENDVNKTSSSTLGKLTPSTGVAARKTHLYKQNLLKGRNKMEAKTTSHVKESKQEQAPKNTNIQIGFSLKKTQNR